MTTQAPKQLEMIDAESWRRRIRADTFSNYHFEMSRALVRTGDLDNGLAALRRALAEEPDRSAYHLELARLLDRLGETTASAERVEIHRHPPSWLAEAHRELCHRAEAEGNVEVALQELHALLETGAATTEDMAWLSFIEIRQGRIDEGTKRLEALSATDIPADLAARIRSEAQSVYNELNFPAACQLYAQAARVLPKDAEVRAKFGLVQLIQGEFTLAEKELRAAIALDSDTIWFHEVLGLCLLALEQVPTALEILSAATARWPEAINLHSSFGLALLRAGQTVEAEKLQQSLISCMPTNNYLHTNLALALAALRRPKEALAAYRRGLEDCPPLGKAVLIKLRPWARETLEDLASQS